MATRPVYSKLVFPSQNSLEIMINIKIKNNKLKKKKKIDFVYIKKTGGVR